MTIFNAVADRVRAKWAACNYDERSFSDIATEALTVSALHDRVGSWDVCKWAITADRLPYQTDLSGHFGQPPLTMYFDERFRIEVLYWLTGLPSIHQHAFSGAFQVLHGSSLHTRWIFQCKERLNLRLAVGHLRSDGSELLVEGDVRTITSGSHLIHSTFHLEVPSITVVVRTNHDSDSMPQYTYLAPTIAYVPEELPQSIQRRLQIFEMLIKANANSEYDELVRYALDSADALAVFCYLKQATELIDDVDYCESLEQVAQRRHATLVRALQSAMVQERRRVEIQRLRNHSDDPELKFFLALLLTVPDRTSLLRLVSQRYADPSPADRILGWIIAMVNSGMLHFPLTTATLHIMRGLIHGESEDRIIASVAALFEDTTEYYDSVLEVCRVLPKFPLFRPLFGSDPQCDDVEHLSTSSHLSHLVLNGTPRPAYTPDGADKPELSKLLSVTKESE